MYYQESCLTQMSRVKSFLENVDFHDLDNKKVWATRVQRVEKYLHKPANNAGAGVAELSQLSSSHRDEL